MITACAVNIKPNKATGGNTTPVVVDVGEKVGDVTFDCNNTQQLFNILAGKTNTTYDQILTLAANPQNATTFKANNADQDLVVTFGDKEWYAVYLSRTNESRPRAILTLWLCESFRPCAWNIATAYDANTAYPNDMYSTSYVRTNGLNNTGNFSFDNGESLDNSYTANNAHAMAKFTMPTVSDAVTDFIVTPATVGWQRAGQSAVALCNYNLKNENWGEETTTGWFNNDVQYNYSSKGHYGDWRNDYLWLPSITELYQYWGVENINEVNPEVTTYWSRSGAYNKHGYIGGRPTEGLNEVNKTRELRPALHLDLSQLHAEHYYVADFNPNNGTTTATCSYCGEVKVYECTDEAHGHLFKENEVRPTCTTDGHSDFVCEHCHYSYRVEKPALGHSFTPWTQVTGQAEGVQQRTCATCRELEKRTVTACTHNITIRSNYPDRLTLTFKIGSQKSFTEPYTMTEFMTYFNGLSSSASLGYSGAVRYYNYNQSTQTGIWVDTVVTAWEKGDKNTFIYYYADSNYPTPVKVVTTLDHFTLIDDVEVITA